VLTIYHQNKQRRRRPNSNEHRLLHYYCCHHDDGCIIESTAITADRCDLTQQQVVNGRYSLEKRGYIYTRFLRSIDGCFGVVQVEMDIKYTGEDLEYLRKDGEKGRRKKK
jgi:hypothetical protein